LKKTAYDGKLPSWTFLLPMPHAQFDFTSTVSTGWLAANTAIIEPTTKEPGLQN